MAWPDLRLYMRPGLSQDGAQDSLYLVEVFLGAGERGRELNHRVTAVVGAADQSGVEQRVRKEAAEQPLGLGVVEREAGGLIFDQLDPVEVAVAPHVADDRQVIQLLQGGAEGSLVRPDIAEQVLLLEYVEVGQRHGAGHRVSGESDSVQEGVLVLQVRLHQPVADHHSAQRRVTRSDALGEGDDVGRVAVPLASEHVTQPAEGADHLVRNHQHAVLVADLAYALEITRRRREAPARILHRLQVNGGHRLRPLTQDGPLNLVRRPDAERRNVIGDETRCTVEVRIRHPHATGRQRLERNLYVRKAGDRKRAVARAVIGDVATQYLVPAWLAGQLEVLLGELPRGFD